MSRRSFGTIRQLGSGRFQVRYRNSTGRMVPGPDTFATKGEAQRWLATAEADQLRGTFVDQRGLRLTFDEWAEEWLATKPGQRAATLARDRAAIRTHFSPAIGDLALPAVAPGHIRSIVTTMQAAGLSPKSVRTYVGTLQAIFGAAVDSDLVARSPVRPRMLGLARVRKPERATLTAEELLRLAGAMPPRYRALVLLAGTVGLRWGEAIGLRIGDVDFLRRRLSVRQTVEEVSGHARVVAATKSEAGKRTFALPAFLVDELAAHLIKHRPAAGPEDLVFLGPKGGILRRSFEARVFKPSVAAVGLPENLTFHGLRHVATTLMIVNNEHPQVIQHRLGHADPAMSLGVYGHVPDDLDRAAAGRLDGLFRPGHASTGSGPAEDSAQRPSSVSRTSAAGAFTTTWVTARRSASPEQRTSAATSTAKATR
jgi:integrase